jgi:hypothetical protein
MHPDKNIGGQSFASTFRICLLDECNCNRSFDNKIYSKKLLLFSWAIFIQSNLIAGPLAASQSHFISTGKLLFVIQSGAEICQDQAKLGLARLQPTEAVKEETLSYVLVSRPTWLCSVKVRKFLKYSTNFSPYRSSAKLKNSRKARSLL